MNPTLQSILFIFYGSNSFVVIEDAFVFQKSYFHKESYIDIKIDSQIDSKIDSKIESQTDNQLDSQIIDD